MKLAVALTVHEALKIIGPLSSHVGSYVSYLTCPSRNERFVAIIPSLFGLSAYDRGNVHRVDEDRVKCLR